MELERTVVSGLDGRFNELAAKVNKLAEPLSQEQFWRKPFSYGNSFGHLLLHLTGNLNYYIGAQMAMTDYVRERDREFNESQPPSKEVVLGKFRETIELVTQTISGFSAEDWARHYTAKGQENVENRFNMVLACLSHFDHHLGQMIYLSFELNKK